MYNTGKVVLGIIVFIALFSSPFLINMSGDVTGMPEMTVPEGECIYPKDEMRANHMDILNTWRDKVVREDIRYTEINGEQVEMSLSHTCMSCHESRKEFCNRCHDYMEVKPYCWDCHVDPDDHKPAMTIDEEAAMETAAKECALKEEEKLIQESLKINAEEEK